MDTQDRSFPAQLSSLWSRLNASEKLIVTASALILVIALGVWITVARQPNMALLLGNLDPTDAAQVVTELQSLNVEYKTSDRGRSILVPADQVDELRIALAGSGALPTGTTGYEILDSSPLGMSDRMQRTRTGQALEGELARTLMSLDEVSAARVHLTVPQPSPFISEQTESAASVVLALSPPGTRLAADKIAAVRTFVAGAISTDANNVTIIDANMNLLTGPTEDTATGLLPTQVEARRNYELQRAADIRSILEPVYGFGKVAVSFSCEMNFDEVQTETLEYEPVTGTDHGVLVSEETTDDSRSGAGYSAPIGVPGVDSNVPTYVGTSGVPYEEDSATEVKNYEVSTMHEMRTMAPGTLESCSVGVVIDSGERQSDDIGAVEITEIEDLVAAATGLDLQGTDTLSVAFRPFDTTLQTDLSTQASSVERSYWITLGIRFLLAFLVLGVFWLVISRFFKPIKGTVFSAETEGFGGEPIDDIDVELPEIDPDTLEKLKIREEIERLIKEDPAAASKVIKTWLKE